MTRTAACALAALAALLLGALPARAEPQQLVIARYQLEHNNYPEALALLGELKELKLLSAQHDKVEAARIGGLAHFYLGHSPEARAAFFDLLLLEPDYVLDQVPPLAQKEFDSVRREKEPQIAEERQRKAYLAKVDEDARNRLMAEDQRLRKESAGPGQVVLQRVEKHSFLINFLPFGAAQLEQGRTGAGALFAIGEGVAVVGSALSYSQVKNRISSDGKTDQDKVSGAQAWRAVNFISFGAVLAVYIGGVVDAVSRFKEETVTTATLPRESVPKALPAADKPGAGTTLFLAPLPGGGGLGFSGSF
jgi:hypothetical protein